VLGKTATPADEEAPLAPAELVAWRPDHEQLVLGWGGSGLRTIVVRPGIVYGGGRGIVSDLIKDALNGLVRVIGPGRNHWPCIYDRDLADLYARLVASPEARGIYHANDEGDERVNDIVEAIAQQVSQTPDVRHMPIG
jgi:nucleoside-diphosphate-sugar epimerase